MIYDFKFMIYDFLFEQGAEGLYISEVAYLAEVADTLTDGGYGMLG